MHAIPSEDARGHRADQVATGEPARPVLIPRQPEPVDEALTTASR